MSGLVGVSDEFLDWLDKCPVQWFLDEQKDDSLTYIFIKDVKSICDKCGFEFSDGRDLNTHEHICNDEVEE